LAIEAVVAYYRAHERAAERGTSHVQDAGGSLAGNDASPISTAVRTFGGPFVVGDEGPGRRSGSALGAVFMFAPLRGDDRHCAA
jgi:hypothetical protein